jgi:hypothetical protein
MRIGFHTDAFNSAVAGCPLDWLRRTMQELGISETT